MTYREREALDDWITGHGGQDQYDNRDDEDGPTCKVCGEPCDEPGGIHYECGDEPPF